MNKQMNSIIALPPLLLGYFRSARRRHRSKTALTLKSTKKPCVVNWYSQKYSPKEDLGWGRGRVNKFQMIFQIKIKASDPKCKETNTGGEATEHKSPVNLSIEHHLLPKQCKQKPQWSTSSHWWLCRKKQEHIWKVLENPHLTGRLLCVKSYPPRAVSGSQFSI